MVNEQVPVWTEIDLVRHLSANAKFMMWFLGAGTSRTAGMPTATDIIWELKKNYYCLKENQDVQKHDINNDAVKRKIQAYMDSKGFPPAWSAEEYSFYFDLTFGDDYGAQQKFIQDQLTPKKISLNIGHRALAGLLGLKEAPIVFTTNFDQVIEQAYAQVAGGVLPTYHLEGSYAALAALNKQEFPIYAKIHGDFRYQSVKNLSKDLLENDEEIRKCMVAAATRYGVVVSGYSGRDENVMRMFHEALAQPNAFPHGLYWTVPNAKTILPSVIKLLKEANAKGVKAFLVETGTFDILLSKLWRQLPSRTDEMDLKVRTARAKPVAIALPSPGTGSPIIRTNGLPIIQCPTSCAQIRLKESIRYGDLREKMHVAKAQTIMAMTDKILAWGGQAEMRKVFTNDEISEICEQKFTDPVREIAGSTFLKAFYEEALTRALRHDKPLLLRQHHRSYSLVVDAKRKDDAIFTPLKQALEFKGQPGFICGTVKGNPSATWAEAVGIRIEEKNGALILLLRPDIWITPQTERQNADDFLRNRKRYRYNSKQYAILDAWIKILLGVSGAKEAVINCLPGTDYPVQFTVNTRSIFTRAEVKDVV